MNIWLSAEETDKVGELPRIASNALEESINLCLKHIEVGEWKKWRVVFIMLPDDIRIGYPETRRLTRKDMALDFRVVISYDSVCTSDFRGQVDLMVDALEKTISYFRKARISPDSLDRIRTCVRTSAEKIKESHSSLK
jgi:hypothetical protein